MARRLVTLVLCATPLLGIARQPELPTVARGVVESLVKSDYAAVFALFDEKMRAALPEEKLRAFWAAVQAQAGRYKAMGTPVVSAAGGMRIVRIPAEFANANADIQIAFNANGTIGGFFVRPAASATAFADAPYVTAGSFVEQSVTVDAGGWPLPATLAVPTGSGPFPAVVLVHGSGPSDRDASFGPNKTFRDLALGLASRGIAALRYEKRTRHYGAKIAPLGRFTVMEESIDDAVAAIRLLRGTAVIDPNRIYVIGHSLGGMLLPRIAAAAGRDQAGSIVLAGAVRSLDQSLVDQSRYLAEADGVVSPEEKTQLAELEALSARIKTLKADDPPVTAIGIGAPASYWVDLRGYHPPTAARQVNTPWLILQGERDYQVTMTDFAQWKAALGARPDVTFKSYAALNHFFQSGKGPSLPAEYMIATHVDPAIVADIAAWILKKP